MLSGSISGGHTNVRVVLVGDRATGKSTLITAAATETFPEEVPPVLPPTRLPADLYPDNVPVTIIDTSSSLESKGKVAEELKQADAVVLTYACDQLSTLNRLTTFWLYKFRRLEVGEKLFGPYEWERFDLLVLPPSFPLGGMENPRMVFLTPTVIKGDASGSQVVAHELAHSWTGNLITKKNNDHFWLNEGFTTYAERRIVEAMQGEEIASLNIGIGWKGLVYY